MHSRDDIMMLLTQRAQRIARRALHRSSELSQSPLDPGHCPLLEDILRLEATCEDLLQEATALEQVARHMETLRRSLIAMRALLLHVARRKQWSRRRARRVQTQMRALIQKLGPLASAEVWPQLPLRNQEHADQALWQIEDAIQILALRRAQIRRAVRLLRQRSKDLDSSMSNYRSVTADVSDVDQALGQLFPEIPQGRSRSTAVLSLLS